MTEDKTYNGWRNYETWLAIININNEQQSQELWQDRGRRALAFAVTDDTFSKEENAKLKLKDLLKDQFERQAPMLADRYGMYADLLNAALSEVDWYEIAESIIDNLPAEEAEDVEFA